MSRTAYGVISVEIPYTKERTTLMSARQPTEQQKEIARLLGSDAGTLAEQVALNTAEGSRAVKAGEYVTTCVSEMPLISLHQPDYNEMTDDPDELLQVLSTKVQRLVSARERGATGTPFESLVRDVSLTAQRLFEKTIGRKSAA